MSHKRLSPIQKWVLATVGIATASGGIYANFKYQQHVSNMYSVARGENRTSQAGGDVNGGSKTVDIVVESESDQKMVEVQTKQVSDSWNHPGVFAWGDNRGHVVAPDLPAASFIKRPRMVSYFNHMVLRDLCLANNVGLAVNDKGDVYMWGTKFDKETTVPEPVFTGKGIVKVGITQNRAYLLSQKGTVYSIALSKNDQMSGPKPDEGYFKLPFLSSKSPISYNKVQCNNGRTPKFLDLQTGKDHVLLLSSKQKVYSCASAPEAHLYGQMGIEIPENESFTKESLSSTAYIIPSLSKLSIKQIAAGNEHSIVLDKDGNIFTFGNNTYGQLCVEPSLLQKAARIPIQIFLNSLPSLASKTAHPHFECAMIAAGGNSTYLETVSSESKIPDATKNIRKELFAAGYGSTGQLGNKTWNQSQGSPVLVKPLSNLYEYSEKLNSSVPIGLRYISVGDTHTAAVLDNIAESKSKTYQSSNYGNDVLIWGGNESYQLGTGKRNNKASPQNMPLLYPLGDKSGLEESSRLQLAPEAKVSFKDENGRSKKRKFEQVIAAGQGTTAVYSKLC